ncbi:MAG: hypothetical protein HZC02_05425 [Candidatus Levybacteria bacterium]|nr:hypothetical protein [Candidatus Levybacteria bacterium]
MVTAERKTIEERGQEMAAVKRARMQTGGERVYPFVRLKHKDILHLPRLATGESGFPRNRFEEDLRFHPTNGEIYSTRWAHLHTDVDEYGVRSIDDPYDYTYINGPSPYYAPEDLPKSGDPIGLVVNQVWDGLETAIRQQQHILGRYNPADLNGEPQSLRRIAHWVDESAVRLREGPVSEKDLESMSYQAASLIEEAGLGSSLDQTRFKIATMLRNACRKDSLSRVNPLVSRTRLRSGLLAATQRIVVGELVTRKFSANLGVLVAEREFTRDDLEQARDKLSQLSDELSTDPSFAIGQARQIAYDHLSFPRVAPYLIPARLSGILLVGCKEEKKDLNRQVLGDGVANDIYGLPSLVQSIGEGEVAEAKRTIEWVDDVLGEALTSNPIVKENIFDESAIVAA